jgi:plasminogen activator inhibitor 1 RNA-binding protein
MESSYGVGVKNRFDLFIDDENDPLDAIAETEKRKQQDKEVKKDTRTPKKGNEARTIQNVKSGSKNESDKKDGEQGERKSGKTDQREKRGQPRDHDKNAAPRHNNERRREQKVTFTDSTEPRSSETKAEDREHRDRFFNDRGTGRGRARGGRGMSRNRRDFEGRGKREFDRRSGSDKSTYRGPNEKREGAGSHNWGSMADDAGEGELFDDTTSSEQEKTTDWANASEEAEKAAETKESTTEETNVEGEEETAAGEEDSVKLMTLDEYKAEQEKLRMKADFKLRKPSEGEDSHRWGEAVPFQRNKDFLSDHARQVTDRQTGSWADKQSDM